MKKKQKKSINVIIEGENIGPRKDFTNLYWDSPFGIKITHKLGVIIFGFV